MCQDDDAKNLLQKIKGLQDEIAKCRLNQKLYREMQSSKEDVGKIKKQEEELRKELDVTKKVVMEYMKPLSAIENEILAKRFLFSNPKTIYQLMAEYNKSYTWVTTTQHKALEKMQKIIEQEEQRNEEI